jgi:protein-tyrosine phosphatase
MVDLHSHILPGLDDGASSFEESLEMLRLAAEAGTTDIVATPHCNAQYPFHPTTIAELVTELAAHSQGAPTIHTGCDFHLSYDNLRDALQHPTKYTINHGPYLLVELPDLVSLQPTRNVLRELLNSRIVPVITHPERNSSVQREIKVVKSWVEDGCLLQITAQSLLGGFGVRAQRAAQSLMNDRLVHFVASDAHDTSHRPPDLSAAFQYVSSRYSAARAERLFVANPTAVIAGEPLRVPKPPLFSRLVSRFRKT